MRLRGLIIGKERHVDVSCSSCLNQALTDAFATSITTTSEMQTSTVRFKYQILQGQKSDVLHFLQIEGTAEFYHNSDYSITFFAMFLYLL